MRGLTIILVLGLASCDKLDRTYLPPPDAKSSGGIFGAADVPLELPRETPSTTIRPRPIFPVRPEHTQPTIGISRGQPSPTRTTQGFSSTTGPFVSVYKPSSTPAYTQSTISEGLVSTVSPIVPTGLPSERPGLSSEKEGQKLRPVYGPNGDIIGVTTTSGFVKGCEKGGAQCKAQQGRPIYGTNGQVIGKEVTPTPGSVQSPSPVYGQNREVFGISPTPGTTEVTPTLGSGQGLRPIYGLNGEVTGVTLIPGDAQDCKENDVNCQKPAQLNVPVYSPSGEIVGYKPNLISTPGTKQGFRPVYGQSGEIIGVTATPETVKVCNKGDGSCQKRVQQNVPIYGPNGQIVGYQPGVQPTLGSLQGLYTPGQQIVPVYGTDGNIVRYKPSAIVTTETVQKFRPVYGPSGQIISQHPTHGTAQVCIEDDFQCQKQAQQNVPVYGPNGEIVGYQPSVTPVTGTAQGLQPLYGPSGQIIGQQLTPDTKQVCNESDVQCQKPAQTNVPIYGPKGKIIGYQPRVTAGTGQGLRPVYGKNGEVIGLIPIPETVEGQKISPVYGYNGQIIGYKPSMTPTTGTVQELQPVHGPHKIVGQQPTSNILQVCKEGDLQCEKQTQQNVPVYGSSGQIVGYQPRATSTQGTSQDQQIIPVYSSSGQIIGYQPSVTSTSGTVQGLQPVYAPSGQVFDQYPTPATLQVCRNGDMQCQKNTLQTISVYGPSGQITSYQPSTRPGLVQELQPIYDSNGKIIGQRPTELVQGCKEGDMQCQNHTQQFDYGPSGQVIGQQASIPTPETVQGLPSVYGPNAQSVGQEQITTSILGPVQTCKKGNVECQIQVRPVYGPNKQIIGQQVIPTHGTTPSFQPSYNPTDRIIGQQPTVLSPTTGKPVYGRTENIYLPGSTSKSPIPDYFQQSSVSTTLAPLNKYETISAGVGINPIVSNAKRPLAESDKAAVTINYDVVHTPDGYFYNFDTSNGIHVDETGIEMDGKKAAGTYSYIGDDGKKYQVSYKADENGFQPTGDHLPTPHPIPADIQRVIEQAEKDKQAGIMDDGLYDEAKYGHERYDRPNRPLSKVRQQHKQAEGYQYIPPKSKFPPRLPGREQTKRPVGKYEEKPITPSVIRGDEDIYEQGAPKSKPSGEQESGITTYRPTGTIQPTEVDKYGRLVPLEPGQGVGSTTYRPSVNPQGQADKFERPVTAQPDQEPVEPLRVDKYGRPIFTRLQQGYSTSTYKPVITTELSQIDKYGSPVYYKPGEKSSKIAEPSQADEYGRPTTSRPGQSTTYRPSVKIQSTQVDKFGRPIYSQAGEEAYAIPEPDQLDKYGRPVPSRPGQGISGTTYRPSVKIQPTPVDKFGRPISSQTEEEAYGISEPGQVDKYGTLIPSKPGPGSGGTTYRPAVKIQTTQEDIFGRPISSQPGEEPFETPGPGQVDEYGRPSKPEQGIGSTTYRPAVKSRPTQMNKLGGPIYSIAGEELSKTPEPGQVDTLGRPISSRPAEEIGSTTYRPSMKVQLTQVDKFGRPIYSQLQEEPSETPESAQEDEYGRPITSKLGLGIGSTTYRPKVKGQPMQVDKFESPIYSQPGTVPFKIAEPGQLDKYGRPIPAKPRQGLSSTIYKPVSTTQAPAYEPRSDVSGRKPDEFGPHEKQGPAYLGPYEDKSEEFMREDFRGPKQPPRFDPKTGYHY